MKPTTGEAHVLRLKTTILAACIAIAATPLSVSMGSADSVGALVAQRQALEQQKASLGPDRAAQLTALAAVEDTLNNLGAELGHNAGVLADLVRQQDNLRVRMEATAAEIATQRKMLASLTRGQYKTSSQDGALSMLFEASNFSQLVNRMMSANKVNHNIADTAKRLKADEASLQADAASLAKKRVAADALQATLTAENGREMAIKAEHDAALARLDANSRSFASQIADLNRKITAAQAPPRFSSGVGGVPSPGSCGNHFTYGYCTWYVANRRCIPWFGNADEWYANARASGYPEGAQARVGAVAVWGAGGGYGGVGHVAYVESVQSDGFTVSEYNYTYGWNHYDTRFVSYGNTGPLFGFIY